MAGAILPLNGRSVPGFSSCSIGDGTRLCLDVNTRPRAQRFDGLVHEPGVYKARVRPRPRAHDNFYMRPAVGLVDLEPTRVSTCSRDQRTQNRPGTITRVTSSVPSW
eukprot:519595-Pyramimonas_sp.AAC.1